MAELLTYFAACIVTAMALLSIFRWRFAQWSIRRTALLAALPLPVLTLLACFWIAIKTAMMPAEHCGIDACGMAMAFSVIVAIVALFGFALSSGIGASVLVLQHRRRQP